MTNCPMEIRFSSVYILLVVKKCIFWSMHKLCPRQIYKMFNSVPSVQSDKNVQKRDVFESFLSTFWGYFWAKGNSFWVFFDKRSKNGKKHQNLTNFWQKFKKWKIFMDGFWRTFCESILELWLYFVVFWT